MKILTLNTHSIIEQNYEYKLTKFVEMITDVSPILFTLQEVNQSMSMPSAGDAFQTGYVACRECSAEGSDGRECEVTIRTDNHAYRVAKMLQEAGLHYQWTWVPAKVGYGVYDEGLAVFSKTGIEDTHQFHISASRDYNYWKTRKMLGICTNDMWFYSVHMGWWDDTEEPFQKQWDRVMEQLKDRQQLRFVMGDFNSQADRKNEGYDYVLRSGWLDTWQLAGEKDDGITVGGVIDGWKDKGSGALARKEQGMRIDYIFCNKEISVKSSEVVFNGENYTVVSDHYGVLVEI